MDNSLAPISGATMAIGAGAIGYGVREGMRSKSIGLAGAKQLDAIVSPAISQIDATASGAARQVDTSYLKMRPPIDRLMDHALNGDIGGPLKLIRFVEQTRALGRVAKVSTDKEIEISRAAIKDANTQSRATASAANAEARAAATQLQRSLRGPATRSAIGLYGGGIALAMGGAAGLVALSQAIDS